MNIALIGDYDKSVVAHQAVPQALEFAADAAGVELSPRWIHSTEIRIGDLADDCAIWCVPLSPYQDPPAVIDAIRHARERDLPFLGTCAGYQHALLEYARNLLEYQAAASREDDPRTPIPLISALSCRLSKSSAYQPERSALLGQVHPLIVAFIDAAAKAALPHAV